MSASYASALTAARDAAAAHLHEHQRAVALAHDKVNLAAAAPRGSIIALDQHQARRNQTGQRPVFSHLPYGTRGVPWRTTHDLFAEEPH